MLEPGFFSRPEADCDGSILGDQGLRVGEDGDVVAVLPCVTGAGLQHDSTSLLINIHQKSGLTLCHSKGGGKVGHVKRSPA